MFEIFKLLWDIVVLRDAARKGKLNWKVWAVGFGFALAVYGIGLPAGLLYQAHPQYKPLFIAAMTLIGILFIGVIWLSVRWRLWQTSVPLTSGKPEEINSAPCP